MKKLSRIRVAGDNSNTDTAAATIISSPGRIPESPLMSQPPAPSGYWASLRFQGNRSQRSAPVPAGKIQDGEGWAWRSQAGIFQNLFSLLRSVLLLPAVVALDSTAWLWLRG